MLKLRAKNPHLAHFYNFIEKIEKFRNVYSDRAQREPNPSSPNFWTHSQHFLDSKLSQRF